MNDNCPCKGCQERRVYCHGGNVELNIKPCKKFASWSELNELMRQQRFLAAQKERLAKPGKPVRRHRK